MTRVDERTVPRSPLARGAAGDERDALGRARLDLGFNVATVALIAFLITLFGLNVAEYPLLGFTEATAMVAVVPEPSSVAMLGVGAVAALGMFVRRYRRSRG